MYSEMTIKEFVQYLTGFDERTVLRLNGELLRTFLKIIDRGITNSDYEKTANDNETKSLRKCVSVCRETSDVIASMIEENRFWKD